MFLLPVKVQVRLSASGKARGHAKVPVYEVNWPFLGDMPNLSQT